MGKIYCQHGDLLLEEISSIPKEAKSVKLTNKIVTLLKGEGVNTHDIELGNLSDVELSQDGETLYLKTNKEIDLIHKEHGKQTLEPNKIYRRLIEREFNYEAMESRNVRD